MRERETNIEAERTTQTGTEIKPEENFGYNDTIREYDNFLDEKSPIWLKESFSLGIVGMDEFIDREFSTNKDTGHEPIQNISNVIFLDKSARPLGIIFNALWEKKNLGPKPTINFMNIGREGRYLEGEDKEAFEQHIQTEKDRVKQQYTYLRDATPGSNVLIIDEGEESGYTRTRALKLLHECFPQLRFTFKSVFLREPFTLDDDRRGVVNPESPSLTAQSYLRKNAPEGLQTVEKEVELLYTSAQKSAQRFIVALQTMCDGIGELPFAASEDAALEYAVRKNIFSEVEKTTEKFRTVFRERGTELTEELRQFLMGYIRKFTDIFNPDTHVPPQARIGAFARHLENFKDNSSNIFYDGYISLPEIYRGAEYFENFPKLREVEYVFREYERELKYAWQTNIAAAEEKLAEFESKYKILQTAQNIHTVRTELLRSVEAYCNDEKTHERYRNSVRVHFPYSLPDTDSKRNN